MSTIGVVFPQTEYGSDPAAVRDYAQSVEGMGYSHVLAYDHVVGANPDRPGGWRGPYTYQSSFLEPLLLFGFMAAITRKLSFATGIIILPQRQTVLFAKQAATLDVLANGRTRIGIGLGWNEVEFTALNEDFNNRGRRMEEQVQVLRALWTQPLVNFSGSWHTIPDAGLNPLPVQRPIPIWFGGTAAPALRRAARLGDGWMVNFRTPAEAAPAIGLLNQYLDEAGRSRASFGIEARIPYGDGNPETWRVLLRDWKAAGATHFSINTMGANFASPSAHLNGLRNFAQAIGLG